MPIGIPAARGISALISGGAGVASSLLNRKQTVTGSNMPQWTPDQQAIQGTLRGLIEQRMKGDGSSLQPLRTAAVEGINRRFRDAPSVVSQKLAARGYGSSGKMGNTLYRMESDRLSGLGDLDAKFAGLQLDQENRIVDEAMRYGFASPGQTSTQTIPGNMLGGGIGAGLETFTSLFALDRLLKGGGGAGMFGGGGSPGGWQWDAGMAAQPG
jgi:hypothetical protein